MKQLFSTDILLCEGFRLDRLGLSRLDPGGTASPVALGSRALDLAWLLADRRGELISKDEIIETVWRGRAVEDNNLTVQISTLRRVFDQARAGGSCIQTVVGHGYRFVAPVTRLAVEGHSDAAALPLPIVGPRPRLSLVVLPFENLGDDRQQQYLVDGITDDLTTDLSRLKDMFVISRTTAFTYRNKPVDIKQISHELGVRYVLEGSVRRAGDRLRLNVQLIDADADTHLWAERFDRRVSDAFALQDEITTAIIGAVAPELLKSERDRIAKRPEHNEDAYEFYQRAMWHHYRQNKTDNLEAQAYFRRALALDPRHSQAAAGFSITLTSAALTGWACDRDSVFEEAYDLAQRAVSLDQRYPNAHFALGLACMWTRRADRGIAAFEEAIKFNPSFSAAHVLLGQMFLYTGRPQEAVEQAEKGIRLSPSDPRMFIWLLALAGAHYKMRHYQEAIEAGRRSWSLNRNWPAGLRYVVAGLAQLGRIEEARAPLLELRRLNTDLAFVEANLRRLYTDGAAIDHLLDGLRKAGFT